jgi:hypothetical protein
MNDASPNTRWRLLIALILVVTGTTACVWWLVKLPHTADPASNSIFVIAPYWYNGTWVFDDSATGLKREPFVGGAPEMINVLVKDIPDAKNGFRLTFSAQPFPGNQYKLTWLRGESVGNWYRIDNPPMEGWLCPALFKYYREAPKSLYVKADAAQN